jgi:hypothetical protein
MTGVRSRSGTVYRLQNRFAHWNIWLPGLMSQSAHIWDEIAIRMTKGPWYHTQLEVV